MKMSVIGRCVFGILLLLPLACVCAWGLGCETQEQQQDRRDRETYAGFPTGATNVTGAGNGWTTFRLDGTKYLYHRGGMANGYECLTAVPNRDAK